MDEDPQEVADRERIFKHCDMNGDGKVSSSELGEALKTLGSVTDEEVKRMMAELDTDGDGYVSYQEFTHFARANPGLVKDGLDGARDARCATMHVVRVCVRGRMHSMRIRSQIVISLASPLPAGLVHLRPCCRPIVIRCLMLVAPPHANPIAPRTEPRLAATEQRHTATIG
ncbi:Probable calcium-binding protein CML28 [Striga hermonthica]|uniref:Probable calcium-binding protein CML28 n=1 Tax=Striga hermonthica TaxID=68872 RepID=A0A9N7P5I4_STRHE|nr:Probable calcium-binding protein CML28 [Striga hermonthica]